MSALEATVSADVVGCGLFGWQPWPRGASRGGFGTAHFRTCDLEFDLEFVDLSSMGLYAKSMNAVDI